MNKRVHEIAKERGLPAKEVLEKLRAAGINVKAVSSSVDEAAAAKALGNGAPRPAGNAAPADAPRKSGDDKAPAAKPRDGKGGPTGKGADGARAPRAEAQATRSARLAQTAVLKRAGRWGSGPADDGAGSSRRGVVDT